MGLGPVGAAGTGAGATRAGCGGDLCPAACILAFLAAACDGRPGRACEPAAAIRSCAEGDDLDCAWARLIENRGDEEAISALLVDGTAGTEGALGRLFAAAGGASLADEPLPAPGVVEFELDGFPPYATTVPIDWTADPQGNNSWRLWFQSLSWLNQFYGPEDADPAVGMAVLEDWVNQSLYADPPVEFSWHDHGLALRLDRAARLADRYVADTAFASRGALQAASGLLLTHLYALSSDLCYKERHNHGVMQDLAILEHVGRYPDLRDGPRLREIAETRIVGQVAASVTVDGVHIENSPEYHGLYFELVTRAIDAFLDDGRSPPSQLVEARDGLGEALVYLLQPNLTLPQFGDSDNRTWRTRLLGLLERARAQAVGAPETLDRLQWVLTRGSNGVVPEQTDRVFVEGGYAAFRERWTAAEADRVVTGHFRTGRLSEVHYQPDETSFEIYGHGVELVVGPGVYGYDPADSLTAYQRTAAAHNVLVVDDDPGEAGAGSRIVAQGGAEGLAWVQGALAPYRWPQVASSVRTFVHAKPDAFVVVDHVRAVSPHRYAQHFHLHPDLQGIELLDDRTVVATTRDGAGPSVVLRAIEPPTAIETQPGWYFPRRNEALEAADVVFRYERTERDLDFPVVLQVAGPAAPPVVPEQASYSETADEITVRWTAAGQGREVVVPSVP